MKLTANKTPYSSVVGGGVMLTDETGKAVFNVMICGTTNGISKEQDAEISERIVAAFNTPSEDVAAALGAFDAALKYFEKVWKFYAIAHPLERNIAAIETIRTALKGGMDG
jgi:hypothetical protein